MLVVDASQGVEAQTLANVYLALNNNLTIVPVINKIDLPAADPENVRRQIEEVIGIDASEAILASAKAGNGIHEILEAIVAKMPPPDRRCRPSRCRRCSSTAGTTATGAWSCSCASSTARCARSRRSCSWRPRASTRSRAWASSRRSRARSASSARARSASSSRPSSEVADARVGDTITEVEPPVRRAAARLQAGQADGVRRHLPHRLGELRGPARRAREAAAQRRLVLLRARDVGGAGLRLPLRVPGPAAHGDRAGAARARVQPRPHHHRADGALPGRAPRRRA